MNNNIQSNQFCDQTVAINYLFLFSVTSEMYHFKKKYFASCSSSSSKLKPIDDEEASTSSAASSASNRGEFPCADLNERCVSPPIRTERGRSQTIYQDSGIRRTEGASFNHSLEGPFVATSSPQKRPQLWPPPVHPHPPHPLLLFPSPGHPYLHPQYIHPNYLLNSIPTLPVMQRVPEPDHSLLRHANLPDLIIEPIKEEQQSPRPPSSITTFGGNSSCSASSPRSPSGSNGRDGSTPPPAQGSRKRRRQDTLVPEGCPLNRRQIVDLAIDEFNELLEKSHFSEEQKAKFRDLRRKGKNRVS